MSVEIRRILHPTDFSPTGQRVLDYAVMLTRQFNCELHVLNVVPDPLPIPGPDGSWVLSDDSVPRLIRNAEVELATRLESSLVGGLKVIRTVRVGHPVTSIIDYSIVHRIDLIVMGTHGHSGISHFLLGSVAEKVVRLATCPVITMHTA